jgi:putative ABC transport system permease protein
MLGHYLTLAARNVSQSGLYVAVSIAGLALGLGAALLVGIYVRDELSYDRWLPNSERLYQISVRSPAGGMTSSGPSDIGKWVAADYPQFEVVTRLFPGGGFLGQGDREFNETITWADANVFDVFAFPVVGGTLDGALDRPDTLVLTRETAEKYFGRADVVGETLVLNDAHPMEVTAVIENLPSNTHLYIDVLAAAHSTYSPAAEQDLIPLTIVGAKRWSAQTYALLRPGEPLEPLRERLWTLADGRSVTNEGTLPSTLWPVTIQSIRAIHLSSRDVANPDNEDLGRLYGALGIGMLIVLAASINFVTLRTALAMRRSLEVGVRKSLGANRRGLFAQFMSEVFVHVTIATVLGAALAAAALPALNAFLLRTIDVSVLASPEILVGIVALLVAVTLLAGAYPALVLASFSPSAATRARSAGRLQNGVRQGLVALQFAIVAAVLIATVVVHRQMAFGLRESLRQFEDPTVILNTSCSDAIKDAMARVEGVREVACSGVVPQRGIGSVGPSQYQDRERVVIGTAPVGIGLFELYDFEPVAGRFFSEDFGTDVTPADNVWTSPEALVLNEAGTRLLGFASAEAAVGEVVMLNHGSGVTGQFTGEHDARIIGVVKDFQMGSVRSEIFPTVFFVDPWLYRTLSMKLDGRSTPETLEAIDRVWSDMGDPGPPQRTFFEDFIEEAYTDLRRDFQLFSVFAGISIVISMLGLVGLAAHTVVARTKEIGVRKVLGSGRTGIMRLLMWQFSKPVLLANVLAWPAAYYAMSRWLEGFARRIELDLWMFVAAALATLAVALATVLVHAWTIAGIRPVTALRHE